MPGTTVIPGRVQRVAPRNPQKGKHAWYWHVGPKAAFFRSGVVGCIISGFGSMFRPQSHKGNEFTRFRRSRDERGQCAIVLCPPSLAVPRFLSVSFSHRICRPLGASQFVSLLPSSWFACFSARHTEFDFGRQTTEASPKRSIGGRPSSSAHSATAARCVTPCEQQLTSVEKLARRFQSIGSVKCSLHLFLLF